MSQTILIAGGSGLIGSRLSQLLTEQGYEVHHLSRRLRPDAPYKTWHWDPATGRIDLAAVDAADCVINLAGAGVADARWTPERKKLILHSRLQSTELLRKAMQEVGIDSFKTYVAASAIGYYGNRGDEWLTETSGPGKGFLAETCIQWEMATEKVAALGVRTVTIRIGLVLSTRGGALKQMLLPLRFLVGAWFGDGNQWYSWIHIDDLCRMFIEGLQKPSWEGVYNGVAPNPERNKDFTKALRQALERPALLLPVPAFALRLALGEMANALLDSTRVSAQKVLDHGFTFHHPELVLAVRDLRTRGV